MWGSRKRDKQRERVLDSHTFEAVKENIKKKSTSLRSSTKSDIMKLQNDINQLQNNLSSLSGRKRVRDYHETLENIRKKNKELEYLSADKHIEEFVELVKPLLSNPTDESTTIQQQRHTVYLNLFYSEKSIPCFVDRDTCTFCNTEYVTLTQESVNMCPKCGNSEHVIYCNSDFIQNEDFKNNPYERGPLYRKYLMQFHESIPDLPDDVINIVYRNLSKVHIMLSSRVKPTPICQILRQEGLQKWAPMAVRIAKIINCEPIVKLSSELIDRLVLRFNKIAQAFSLTKKKERKKIMNFEFLTKQFLIMENRPDLSEWYNLHKTRTVLFSADTRFEKCCKAMKNDELNWNISRSC